MGTQHGAGAATELDRAAPDRERTRRSSSWCSSKGKAQAQPGVGEQRHRQPALALLDALARARRDDVHRRTDAAPRPGRRLFDAWTSRRATATATRWSASPATATRTRPQSRSAALQMANAAATRPQRELHRTHVGYYLIDAGSGGSGARGGDARPPLAHRLRRTVARRPLAWFGGAIVCAMLGSTMVPLVIASNGLSALR